MGGPGDQELKEALALLSERVLKFESRFKEEIAALEIKTQGLVDFVSLPPLMSPLISGWFYLTLKTRPETKFTSSLRVSKVEHHSCWHETT